ncbi:hypothetical protein [Saliphagus sp. LR7]|uniref:hypothetical protein n=1 Tax=Saliphagus sp. LR7 TaxID=2282654 RepID=UPI000DF73E79|nr:hypothetical protein [Saliphagus sp. LR7]
MDPVRIALVGDETDTARALTETARAEPTLAVEQTVSTVAVTDERADFDAAQCVVVADDAIEAPLQNLYEQLRIVYAGYPTVIVSSQVSRPFIDHLLADSAAEFVYAPDDDLPARLLAARCRSLLAGQ